MVIKPDALYNTLIEDLLASGLEPQLVDGHDAHLHIDTRQAAMGYQAQSFLKRCYRGEHPLAETRAVDEFVRCNNICAGDSISYDEFVVPDVLDVIFGEAKLLISGILDASNDSVQTHGLVGLWRCGPGANLGVGRGMTSLYDKLSSALQFPSRDAELICRAAWSDTIMRWGPKGSEQRETSVQECVNLITVRKNSKIRRTITTHTNGGTAGQLSIAAHLRYGLAARTGIDIKTQADRHRRMIRDRWTGLATIDLKSASNLISLKHVRFFFGQHPLIRWLEAFREKGFTYKGKKHTLHMYAGMGNGITFPLQTILFLSLAYGVYRFLGVDVQWPSDSYTDGNIGVFGDDIVVVPEAFDLLCKVLRALNMEPNHDKSFVTGPFRESCGVDTHCGVNIRPVYLLSSDCVQDLNDLFNRLMSWSVRHQVPLYKTLGLICRRLRRIHSLFLIPLHAVSTGGLRVPLGIALRNSQVTPETDSEGKPFYDGFAYHYLSPKPSKRRVAAGTDEDGCLLFDNVDLAMQSIVYGELDTEGMVNLRIEPDRPAKVFRAVAISTSWNDCRIDNPTVQLIEKVSKGGKNLLRCMNIDTVGRDMVYREIDRGPSAQDIWRFLPSELITR